jgi:hypothetical protein
MTGVTSWRSGESELFVFQLQSSYFVLAWLVYPDTARSARSSLNEVTFPGRHQTPAGGPEHVPVMVYTQIFTSFFLYFLTLDLVGAHVGLPAGLHNA